MERRPFRGVARTHTVLGAILPEGAADRQDVTRVGERLQIDVGDTLTLTMAVTIDGLTLRALEDQASTLDWLEIFEEALSGAYLHQLRSRLPCGFGLGVKGTQATITLDEERRERARVLAAAEGYTITFPEDAG